MRVDFYQLGRAPVEEVIGSIADKLLGQDSRLLVVADDEPFLARLDRMLWDRGATSFLPHGLSGGADDARQPVLLSTTLDAPNGARNLLVADGRWREAPGFERLFYLFDAATLEAARSAWKALAGRESVERNFWRQDDKGAWVRQA